MPTIANSLLRRLQPFTAIESQSLLLAAVLFFALSAVILSARAIYLWEHTPTVLRQVLGATGASFKFQVALLAVAYVVRKIVFGAIGSSELQWLYDRLWSFLVDSLLAITICYCSVHHTFAVMLAVLLLMKSLHWLAADRIDWTDRGPHPGPLLLIHISMVALCAVLWAADILLFLFTADRALAYDIGGMLIAGEYGILIATVANTSSRYLLYVYEHRWAGKKGGDDARWENKQMWVFWIEVATYLLKVAIYLVFFTIIMVFHGMPLNILHNGYLTTCSLITRLQSPHRYPTLSSKF